MQKLDEDDEIVDAENDDDDHQQGDNFRHHVATTTTSTTNSDDSYHHHVASPLRHHAKGRQGLKELASRYHDMEAEMQMEENARDEDNDDQRIDDDEDDDDDVAESVDVVVAEGQSESPFFEDASGARLKKSESTSSTGSDASNTSNVSHASGCSNSQTSMRSYSSATSVLSAMSLGAATVTSVEVVEEEEEEEKEGNEEDEEDGEEICLEPNAENSSLLKAIEAHLKANNYIDSDDVVCSVGGLPVENGSGGEGVIPQMTSGKEAGVDPVDGTTVHDVADLNAGEHDGPFDDDDEDDHEVDGDAVNADGDDVKTPTVKLKRKKSLRDANITVTKGTHGVLERNKHLSKVQC